jgi:adenylosuccinate synthase
LNGRQIDSLPGNLEDFQKVGIKYATLKGWQKDISKINKA